MAMKKQAVKAAAFLVIFCALFLVIQEVIRYKAERGENMSYRYAAFLQEPEDSLDILFVGSSPVYAGIAPTLIWKETGMTSVNFGVSNTSAMISYYQLRFALQTQSPDLVVMDFNSICRDRTADQSDAMEAAYRKNVDAMPDWKLKAEMILQIGKDNEKQNIWSYFFPLLQYHSRWNELEESDFEDTKAISFPAYKKGALFRVRGSEEEITYEPALFELGLEESPLSEYSWGYYKKALELCAENGIPVAIVSFPKGTTEDLIREYRTLEIICAENSLNYYNLNEPAMWERYGFDAETDFYNTGHVNANGAVKVSLALAEILQEDYKLSDHRGDTAYSSWDDDWEAFFGSYEKILSGFGY